MVAPARYRRTAFTLIEALVAIILTALAGSVLLMGTNTALQTTNEAVQQTIALGLAQQMMDEIVGCRYFEYGGSPYEAIPGPTSAEAAGGTRQWFDDIGDFNGVRNKPPLDCCGIQLGKDDGQGGTRMSTFQAPSTYFTNWRREVDVYYVDPSNLSARLPTGQTSDYRIVEVRVIYTDPLRGDRQYVQLRRVVSYVPPF